MWLLGLLISLVGLVMCIRGWVYTLKPDGTMALKRQQKNMRLGFTTNMPIFGRKIRRLGLILFLIGGFWIWRFWG